MLFTRTVGTTKIGLTRSTNLPKIVPFLRYHQPVLAAGLPTHSRPPTCHLLDPAVRQPGTISHRCRRGPVLPSPRPCTRRCTLNLTRLLHAALRPSIETGFASSFTSPTLLSGRAQNANASCKIFYVCCR